MTALTKFIIGSVISFFGSLTPTDPAGNSEHGVTGQVQEDKTEEFYVFPAKKDCEGYNKFTCFKYDFKEKLLAGSQ